MVVAYDPINELAITFNGECYENKTHTMISCYPHYDKNGDLVQFNMACAECLKDGLGWRGWTYSLDIYQIFKVNHYDEKGVREALDYINPYFWKLTNMERD